MDQAFWVALAVLAGGIVLGVWLWPRRRPPPQCPDCKLEMERQEQALDEDRVLSWQFAELPRPQERTRTAYFRCPRCQRRMLARY